MPRSIRLVRQGDVFIGYEFVFTSSSWVEVGRVTIEDMPAKLYVGVDFCSSTIGEDGSMMFDLNVPFTNSDIIVDGMIDFKDYAVLASTWMEEILWP